MQLTKLRFARHAKWQIERRTRSILKSGGVLTLKPLMLDYLLTFTVQIYATSNNKMGTTFGKPTCFSTSNNTTDF